MWNIPAKFPIHLFTAAVQNRTKGFSAGLGEVRPKQRKQPCGTSCFQEPGFKCWEFFSSQLEDRSACNESLTCWEYLHLHWYFDLLVWGKKCWSVECSRWVCRSGTVVIMSPQFKKKVLGWSFCVDLADFLHVPVGSSQTHVRYINCWPHCCPDNVCVGIKNYVPADLKHSLNNI